MLYAVLFQDAAEAPPDLRARHMAAHLEFLESHAPEIRAAGPLFSEDGSGAGGLWLVEAADPAAVWALVHDDPFWPTGLRARVEVLAWRQVFAEGRRLTD